MAPGWGESWLCSRTAWAAGSGRGLPSPGEGSWACSALPNLDLTRESLLLFYERNRDSEMNCLRKVTQAAGWPGHLGFLYPARTFPHEISVLEALSWVGRWCACQEAGPRENAEAEKMRRGSEWEVGGRREGKGSVRGFMGLGLYVARATDWAEWNRGAGGILKVLGCDSGFGAWGISSLWDIWECSGEMSG